MTISMEDLIRIAATEESFNSEPFSKREQSAFEAQEYNAIREQGKYLDCPKCGNKGYIAYVGDDDGMYLARCDCSERRKSKQRIKNSGLEETMETKTFDTFKAVEDWQTAMKNIAVKYADNCGPVKDWLYLGGQVGCGKTHLCTAVTSVFLNSGYPAAYMMWRDDITRLKNLLIEDKEAYSAEMSRLKNIDVLYIDDFLKTEKGKPPTTADINIAFELINYRYINQSRITIISSELSIKRLIEIDEAVGSRIYERTQEYCLVVGQDITKNMRLRGKKNAE